MIPEAGNTMLFEEMLWDMHTHLTGMGQIAEPTADCMEMQELALGELNYRRSQNIAAFFSCGTPLEWEFMEDVIRKFSQENRQSAQCRRTDIYSRTQYAECGIKKSFGIHPWYSGFYDPNEYSLYYKKCDAIGEIGMDSVWCDVPLKQQQNTFEMQLRMAAELGKPVILHTKGQERKIAEMIQDFPGKICVHWYSGKIELLEPFIQKGCYFTLGPDFVWNFANSLYQFMIKNIPTDRLLLETDGLDAVIWAYEENGIKCADSKRTEEKRETAERWELLKVILNENLQKLSGEKMESPKGMRRQLQQNLFHFLEERTTANGLRHFGKLH